MLFSHEFIKLIAHTKTVYVWKALKVYGLPWVNGILYINIQVFQQKFCKMFLSGRGNLLK